uniref:ORF, purN, purH genes n=1 Tax=Corynebacterium ammoniagenes TaxID=1697 RepID=Q9RHX8_CORAM|nr:unnamed protein product [Corynebacterium ammoniagenes] [Corynebacterium stationis]
MEWQLRPARRGADVSVAAAAEATTEETESSESTEAAESSEIIDAGEADEASDDGAVDYIDGEVEEETSVANEGGSQGEAVSVGAMSEELIDNLEDGPSPMRCQAKTILRTGSVLLRMSQAMEMPITSPASKTLTSTMQSKPRKGYCQTLTTEPKKLRKMTQKLLGSSTLMMATMANSKAMRTIKQAKIPNKRG